MSEKTVDLSRLTRKTFNKKSTWVNNTNDTFKFELMTGESFEKGAAYYRESVEIKPGESVELQSHFDNSIRVIDNKNGRIVAGLCPMLTKVGEENVEVEPCLDYRVIVEEQKLAALAAKIEKEKAFSEARVRVAEAELKAKEIKEVKKAGRPKAE